MFKILFQDLASLSDLDDIARILINTKHLKKIVISY